MTELWESLVGSLQQVLVLLTGLLGGNPGSAIIALSCSIRIILLPLTFRIAQRVRRRQRVLESLQPRMAELKVRYADDPRRLSREIFNLHRENGVGVFDAKSIAGTLLQMPVIAGLSSAIGRGLGAGRQFLWIRDLAQPDVLLGLLVGVLTLGITALAPGLQSHTRLLLVLPTILTLVIMSQISSGVGLFWVGTQAVGLIQALMLRRPSSGR